MRPWMLIATVAAAALLAPRTLRAQAPCDFASEAEQARCLALAALVAGDASLCDDIDSAVDRQRCLMAIARTTGQIVCGDVEDELTRIHCDLQAQVGQRELQLAAERAQRELERDLAQREHEAAVEAQRQALQQAELDQQALELEQQALELELQLQSLELAERELQQQEALRRTLAGEAPAAPPPEAAPQP